MKKFYSVALLFLLIAALVQGQTTKMLMYEGFTSANCPPCVPNNQTINPIILVNPTKVVALKYHTNWPGGADFVNQNTQVWVGPRVTYYGVSGVPSTRVNGTGTSLSQTVINQQYTNTSPFFLEINHSFNADTTQVVLEVKIKAAQDYTGNQLVLHLAMVEKFITFPTAPGYNGETEFHHAMRAMYPSASGTSLQNTWAKGQEQTLNFTVDVPTYIYKKSQIAFVTFIQSNQTKAVLQAAKTIKDFDGVLTLHNLNRDPVCRNDFEIEFSFVNSGKNSLTSFDVVYGEAGTSQNTFTWTGSLAPGETTTVSLPAIDVSGSTNVSVSLSNPNESEQQEEFLSFNGVAAVYTDESFEPISLEEDFNSTSFPPEGWVTSSSSANHAWHRHTAGGGSARVNFFNIPSGQVDNLYVEPVDLLTNGSVLLTFRVAHAMYDSQYGPNDRLLVQVSTNCGQNWNTVFSKAGSALATAPNTTASFVPSINQWRQETVDLSNYNEHQNVKIRFRATSGYGNNLYIDDVKILASSYLVFFEVEGNGGTLMASTGGADIESGSGVAAGSEVVFTATPNNGYLIKKWIVNGQELQNNTDQEINVSNINKLVNVKVEFRVDNTNIQYLTQSDVRIFPVPAKTQLSIVSEEIIQHLSMLNLAGQEVYAASNLGLSHNVNVSNLSAGIYVLRMRTQQGLLTKKIQVE